MIWYLNNLAARNLNLTGGIQPRLASRFEPMSLDILPRPAGFYDPGMEDARPPTALDSLSEGAFSGWNGLPALGGPKRGAGKMPPRSERRPEGENPGQRTPAGIRRMTGTGNPSLPSITSSPAQPEVVETAGVDIAHREREMTVRQVIERFQRAPGSQRTDHEPGISAVLDSPTESPGSRPAEAGTNEGQGSIFRAEPPNELSNTAGSGKKTEMAGPERLQSAWDLAERGSKGSSEPNIDKRSAEGEGSGQRWSAGVLVPPAPGEGENRTVPGPDPKRRVIEGLDSERRSPVEDVSPVSPVGGGERMTAPGKAAERLSLEMRPRADPTISIVPVPSPDRIASRPAGVVARPYFRAAHVQPEATDPEETTPSPETRPTVRVTIGRIEVRASTRPSPSRDRGRQPEVLSLKDYLNPKRGAL